MINYLVDSKARADISDIANKLPSGKITVSETEPLDPQEGDLWFKIVTAPELPMDYRFRFKASELNLANNAKVATWADMSSNGFNLVQATSSNQPTYLSAGVNSKPAVSFNGSASFMTSNVTLDNANGATCFIVMKLGSVDGSMAFVNLGVESTTLSQAYAYILRKSGSSGIIEYKINDNSTANILTSNVGTNLVLLTGTYDKSNNIIYKNGSVAASTPYTSNIGTVNKLSVGRSLASSEYNYANVLIQEIVYFSRKLSLTELEMWHTALINEYGII